MKLKQGKMNFFVGNESTTIEIIDDEASLTF